MTRAPVTFVAVNGGDRARQRMASGMLTGLKTRVPAWKNTRLRRKRPNPPERDRTALQAQAAGTCGPMGSLNR